MGLISKFVQGAAGGGVVAFGEEVRNQAALRREQALLNIKQKIDQDAYRVRRDDELKDQATEKQFRGDMALVESYSKLNQSAVDSQEKMKEIAARGVEDRKTKAMPDPSKEDYKYFTVPTFNDLGQQVGETQFRSLKDGQPQYLNDQNQWATGVPDKQITPEILAEARQRAEEEANSRDPVGPNWLRPGATVKAYEGKGEQKWIEDRAAQIAGETAGNAPPKEQPVKQSPFRALWSDGGQNKADSVPKEAPPTKQQTDNRAGAKESADALNLVRTVMLYPHYKGKERENLSPDVVAKAWPFIFRSPDFSADQKKLLESIISGAR